MLIIWLFVAGVVAASILAVRYPKEAGWLAAAVSLLAAILGLRLVLQDAAGRIELYTGWNELFPLDIGLYYDSLSALMVCLIGVIGLVAALASIERAERFFPPVLLITLGIATSAVLAAETLSFAIASLLLASVLGVTMFAREARSPARQFFYIVGGASGIFLVAATYLGLGLGVTNFLLTNASDAVLVLPRIEWVFAALALVIVAWCCWVPLHTWATGASSRLSAASEAWLLALPPLVGLYLFLRTWPLMSRVQPELPFEVLPVIGCLTLVVASYAALHQQSLRRVAAFVVVAQLGLVPIGMGTYRFEGSISSLLSVVTFAISAPVLFLSVARLGEALSRPEEQEPFSFWLAVAGLVAVAGAPITVGFTARQTLMRSLVERPDSSLFFVLGTVMGSAFITLAIAGVLHRAAEGGVTIGSAEAPLDAVLMRPAVAALAVPMLLVLLLGVFHTLADILVYPPASVVGSLLPSVVPNNLQASAWATLLALAGPGIGLLLYAANEDCARWPVKVLGIQQCSPVIPQRWWSYLEKADLFQLARLFTVVVVDSIGKAVEVVGERLAR